MPVTHFSPNYGLVNPSVALVCDFGFDLHSRWTRGRSARLRGACVRSPPLSCGADATLVTDTARLPFIELKAEPTGSNVERNPT